MSTSTIPASPPDLANTEEPSDGTLTQPTQGQELFADALLDRVQLGVELIFPVTAVEGARAIRAALNKAGRGATLSTQAREIITLHNFAVPLVEGFTVELQGTLKLTSSAGRLTIAGSSHLILNLLRAVRQADSDPAPPAFDGALNLVGARDDYRTHLSWQLDAAQLAVDGLVRLLAEAAGVPPDSLLGGVWVQHVEVCRDHHCPQPEELVTRLADMPVPGARSARQRRHNMVCLSWSEGTKAPVERKIYAKAKDLLRFEVAVRSRDALYAMLRGAGEADRRWPRGVSGEGVAAELAAAARAAGPYLEEAEAFAKSAEPELVSSGLDFVAGLAPLAMLTMQTAQGANGRPRNEETRELARRALAKLLDDGTFDARGIHSASPVLVELARRCEAGVLVAGVKKTRVFTVAPRFEAARQALRGTPLAAPLG